MSLRVHVSVLVVAAALLALFGGCGKSGGKVIATVGGYDITMQEFNDLSANYNRPFKTAQEEFDFKSMFLDSLIIQRLLVQDGVKRGMDKAEAVTTAVLQNKDKFLLDVLYQKEILDKAPVTDAQLQDYYNKLANKIHVAQIMVSNLDTAKALVQRLADGANFEQLAYDYSQFPNAKQNRGDMGFILWGAGANLPEFEDAAFNLKPGEVSPPIKTQLGYHIIKLVDLQPNQQRGEFEKTKASLEKSLKAILQTRRTVLYVGQIREKYPITVDTTTCAYLIHKRNELYPPEVIQTLPKGDFDESQLDRNEKELVMATWEGGQVSVVDYLNGVRKVPAAYRPDFSKYDSVQFVVFQMKLTDILTFEANKLGLENDDQFKRKTTLFRELTVADMLKNDTIMKPPQPTEDELRAYYDSHKEEFTEEPRIHLYEIQVSDEMLASKLAKQIRSLDAFKKKSQEVNERQGRKDATGDMGYIVQSWFPEIFDAAWKTPVGEIGGPVVAQGKYSIFYVVDKVDQTLKDFLGVKQQIATTLMGQSAITRFSDWVKENKEKTKISVDTAVLWSTISKDKYATADSTTTPPAGQ